MPQPLPLLNIYKPRVQTRSLSWSGMALVITASLEFRDFLEQINQGEEWKVHCLRLAPYAPAENPIEKMRTRVANSVRHRELSVWGQAKQLLRQLSQRCRSFKFTKKLFELFIEYDLFTVPHRETYGAFSTII